MSQTRQSETKLIIRRHVLMLGTFTVDDLERLTGFNPNTIHSEIRRMQNDGYVDMKSEKIDGQREVRYRLVSDSAKRWELDRSLARVASQLGPAFPPTNYEYLEAVEILDEAEQLTQANRLSLLARANSQLRSVWKKEGAAESAVSMQARIYAQLGRLRFLEGKIPSAEKLLQQARIYRDEAGLAHELGWVDESLTLASIAQKAPSRHLDGLSSVDMTELLAEVLRKNPHLRVGPLARAISRCTLPITTHEIIFKRYPSPNLDNYYRASIRLSILPSQESASTKQTRRDENNMDEHEYIKKTLYPIECPSSIGIRLIATYVEFKGKYELNLDLNQKNFVQPRKVDIVLYSEDGGLVKQYSMQKSSLPIKFTDLDIGQSYTLSITRGRNLLEIEIIS